MKTPIYVLITQELRAKPVSTATILPLGKIDKDAKIETELVYTAHIETGHSDHHAEGPTPAMALVDAALHWERYERGRR